MKISFYFILNIFFFLSFLLKVKSIKYSSYLSENEDLDKESYESFEIISKYNNNIIELDSNYIITKLAG
jgi:hypothetical protein